ncbi:MAG: CHASE2 domain-containing protein, partial [Planctomycetota bacterium]
MPAPTIPEKGTPATQERSATKKGRDLLVPFAIAFVLLLLPILLWKAGALRGFERLAYDSLFRLRHRLHPSTETQWHEAAKSRIAIIEVDDISYDLLRIKGAPPRRFFARVIEKSTKAKAKVVGFDYWFPRQEYPDSQLAQIHKNLLINAKKALEKFQGIRTGSETPAKGFASGSEREFLADFGLLDAEDQATLREHEIERWRAYFAEVK